MPDPYASITAADPATLERLVAVLELRAADLLRRGILKDFVAEIDLPKEAKLLEIGCGTGAVTRFLADLPQVSQALGIDPSPVFIAKARELAGRIQNLTFQEADGRSLPCEDRSFDVVLFYTSLCHIPKPEEAVAEALRVLRPGGWLAIFDGDYATTSVGIGNFDPLQCCADAAMDGLVYDRWLMRRLPAMLRAGGCEPVQSRSYGYTSLPDPSYMFTLVNRGADLLLSGGRIGPGLADALKAEARRRAEVDRFYGLIVFVSAVARKPVKPRT
jgi:ubiquinone/menaquinone biosynthesis C-methylase UbiE